MISGHFQRLLPSLSIGLRASHQVPNVSGWLACTTLNADTGHARSRPTGLALGGLIIAKRMPTTRNHMDGFIRAQVGICIYPLILPVLFIWLSGTNSTVISWFGSNILLPFIPIIAGILGGIQFPLANKICIEENEESARAAGLSYSLDLAGACVGALLATAILVPILGIIGTCLLTALINVTVLAALKIS